MKKGIDISKWQGTVDFSKVKKEVDFVILREGYRKQIDQKFLEYVEGCKNNGIPVVGVYHFCYATSEADAVEEAKSCINNIEKAGLAKKDIVVFFDFEYDTVKQAKEQGVTLGKKQCIAFTRAFCDYVESQGYTAGVYSNLDYYKNMYDMETIGKYVYWLADYTLGPDVKCTYHQYTSSGKVSGISGNVDMNYYYGEEKEEEDILSGSTQSTAKSNTEIAREVIAGKWDNGDDRKKKLNAAGYNYTEIQKKVNELLGSSGSGKKSVTEIACEVIAGKWGNGAERKKKLKAAGYDYNEVQKKVNQLL